MGKPKNSLYTDWYKTVLKEHLKHDAYSSSCGICKEELKFYIITSRVSDENFI